MKNVLIGFGITILSVVILATIASDVAISATNAKQLKNYSRNK